MILSLTHTHLFIYFVMNIDYNNNNVTDSHNLVLNSEVCFE